MRLLLILALYNIINVTLAEIDIINEDLGHLYFTAMVGDLPLKYKPLSEVDLKASEKAADFIDFLPLVPSIDPLRIPVVPPFSFKIPFLFLKAEIYLANIFMSGIKQLQMNDVQFRFINLRTDLNISIPKIHFEVDFGLKAQLSFLPILFNAHISVNLTDIGVVISTGGYRAQAPQVGEVLQIDSARLNFNVGNVVFNLTNIDIGDPEQTEEYRYAENYNPATNYDYYSNRFSDDPKGYDMLNGILKTALTFANQQLLKIPITAFTDYLLSDSF